MRRISANYIIPISSPPIKNGIVETDDDGTIRKVYDFGGEMRELAHTEFLNGVLVPGLINMHTHVELSWMKRINPPHMGIIDFIRTMRNQEIPPDAEAQMAIADDFMYRRGIVAICDISNTPESIKVKRQSKIRYHTMVETSGLKNEIAIKRIESAKTILKKFHASNLAACISPHAPYSVSEALWNLLQIELSGQTVSIHNQESEHENPMFVAGKGKLIEDFKAMQLLDYPWKPTGKTSLLSVIKHLLNTRLLLVHNIYTSRADIQELLKNKPKNTGIVLCPTSNIHIEGKLPDIELLSQYKLPIMLGTDSTASGKSPSLLDEMIYVQKSFDFSFEEILRWATLNAANFMNWSDLGSFETGKRPGINLINHFDFETFKLKPHSSIRRVL